MKKMLKCSHLKPGSVPYMCFFLHECEVLDFLLLECEVLINVLAQINVFN